MTWATKIKASNIHHRHEAYDVKAPPKSGPQTTPIFDIPIIIPKYFGRLCNGIDADAIVMPPFMSPELPMPATTLPTISILDEVATPHRREPSSKIAKYVRNVYCPIINQVSKILDLSQKAVWLASYLRFEVGV